MNYKSLGPSSYRLKDTDYFTLNVAYSVNNTKGSLLLHAEGVAYSVNNTKGSPLLHAEGVVYSVNYTKGSPLLHAEGVVYKSLGPSP